MPLCKIITKCCFMFYDAIVLLITIVSFRFGDLHSYGFNNEQMLKACE